MDRIPRLFSLAAAALVAIAMPGCMSLEHVLDPDQKLEMYGGTKRSYAYIEDDSSPFFGSLVRVVDFPLTVVLDTVILPVSAPVELLRDDGGGE